MNQQLNLSLGQDTISYQLTLSKRRSLAIVVYPNQSIIVKAPLKSKLSFIEKAIIQRKEWIKKQLDKFAKTAVIPPLKYTDGEAHLYLGLHYQLQMSRGKMNTVLLNDKHFHVICKNEITPLLVKKNLDQWYLKQSRKVFETLLDQCWNRCQDFHSVRPVLKVRKMKSRWGSYSRKDHTVTLNSELIKATQSAIESVILHEYCHIKHFNHSPAFYRLLEQFSPDWRGQKKLLSIISPSRA